MFKRCLLLAAGLCCVYGGTTSAHADTIASVFDTDRDGWLVKDIFNSAGIFTNSNIAGTYTPVFQATGGNPGGYISQVDPTNNDYYWYAPSKFLGNQSAAYGGVLSFDLFDTPQDNPYSGEAPVVLIGNGLQLVGEVSRPGTTFTHKTVGLTESGWHVDSINGVAATKAQMQSVLSSLSDVFIGGEYQAGDDAGGLDNVILTRPGAVPEPSLVAGMGLGATFGVVWLLRRRRAGIVAH